MALIAKPFGVQEIFICNTSNIDSMRHGRPQTVLIEEGDATRQNGEIITLTEATKETKLIDEMDHVYGIETDPTKADMSSLVGKFIVVEPEINVEQYRRIDNSLAAFGKKPLQPGTHTAYELQKRDRIEYSEAYFKACQEAADETAMANFHAALIPNATCKIDDQGRLVIEAGGPLRIVSVVDQRKPLMMDGLQGAMPQPYKMVKLEVVK